MEDRTAGRTQAAASGPSIFLAAVLIEMVAVQGLGTMAVRLVFGNRQLRWLVLAAVQLRGAFGRVFWSAVADATGCLLSVLSGLALAIVTAALIVACTGGVLPLWALIELFLSLCLTANSWNGVYLSKVARLSPAHAQGSVISPAAPVRFTHQTSMSTVHIALHAGGYSSVTAEK